MAADSLNLAETYSPVGSHLDKSDNLHLNGDYHKMLACSHVIHKIIGKIERTTALVVVPPRYETIIKKQASLLGKRCLLLLVISRMHITIQR